MSTHPALVRGWRKAARTLVQMIASGALTAAVTALAGGLDPTTQALVAAGWLFVVTFSQNAAETAGKIPVLLPSPGLVSSAASSTTEAVVEAHANETGEVEGVVTDLAGGVVGEVVGQLGYVEKKEPVDPLDSAADDSHLRDENGGAVVAFVLIMIGVAVVFAFLLDACQDDPDEADDLWVPATEQIG